MTSPATALKNPPTAAWRWGVLVAISVAMFGNYYTYDSIAPVADLLQRELHFSDTQIGAFNSFYSFMPILVVLVGGIIIDRFGTRLSTLIFSLICLVGAVLTAITPSFVVMALGRLIFGAGAETMIVAITVAIGQWFVGRQLGLAFGLNLSIARGGSFLADKSTSWFKPLYDAGWQPPLWLAAGFSALAVVACLVYYVAEGRAAKQFALVQPTPPDKFVWSDIWRFDRSYWYNVGLCVTFYSVIFPFRSTFAIKYFQHAHGLSLEDAGTMNSHVFAAAIVFTPLFGWMVDKLGHRAAFMAFGSLLLAAVFPLLIYTNAPLWVSTVLLGIAFCLVPAVIWPAVPYLVEPHRLGTAYGLMTMVQNVGLFVFNLAAGALNDASGAGPSNPGGYTPMLLMFMLLSLFGFVFAALLRARETSPQGHGLESIRAGAALQA
ncbi:MAG TPA: MFS transporter [Vicinamibacterales bacterium]|nr:MFS transporter [Vicinamibacterales bacterium]